LSITVSKARTTNYFKQLKGSVVFKLLAIGSSFLIIPLMIKYLGIEQYGIWSTLLSILSWVILFDIGIGNGLRNKISESLAKDNRSEARNYISTAYVILGFISIALLTIFFLVSSFIPWQSVFNTSIVSNQELKYVMNIVVFFLILNFWFSLINQVFNGLQKTSLVVFNQFLSNLFSLISVYILYEFFDSSLLKLSFAYGVSLLLSSIILSIWFYSKNRELIPQLKRYGKHYTKSITSLGFKFFIIQIAVIVIFTTDKVLITQLFGPEYVTSYDVVFKLFSVITIAYGLIAAPLWSAYSDAYHRNDLAWIKSTLKNQLKIYLLIIVTTVILILSTKTIILFWIGESLTIDTSLIITMGAFILVSTWNSIFASFINASNQLSIQINTSIIAIIINIPLSILLVKYFHFGVSGVVIGTILSLSLFAVFGSIQTYKLLHKGKH
jgi:O-antigen/teichoic acid export membrane protein